eukprot:361303-Heterocapsa_arctica.AAC.1
MGTRRLTAPPRTRTCGPRSLMGPIGTACLPACLLCPERTPDKLKQNWAGAVRRLLFMPPPRR